MERGLREHRPRRQLREKHLLRQNVCVFLSFVSRDGNRVVLTRVWLCSVPFARRQYPRRRFTGTHVGRQRRSHSARVGR
eukprot:3456169-Rhodomonas_salina.12